jgi:single-strand DNA-binding protein
MNGVNKAIILGHLGGDPDIKHTTTGKAVATFSVATGQSWRDKDSGERKERTEWHRVVIFTEGLVKVAEQYLRKGAKVYIEGEMRTRKWTSKGGEDHWTTEIVLTGFNASLQMLDRRDGAPPPDENAYGTTKTTAPAGDASAKRDDIDDEIPF